MPRVDREARCRTDDSSISVLRWIQITVIALISLAILAGAASYSRALGVPGPAPFADKSSRWAYEHHLGPEMDLVMDWLSSRHHHSLRGNAASVEPVLAESSVALTRMLASSDEE